MRLFVALNLPKKERARIHRAAAPLRDEGLPVRWLDPENYHLTLKFLGNVRQERADEVRAIMQRVAGTTLPFSLALGGFGAFPTVRKPRVVWLGIVASAELRCLKQDLEWGLADAGFEAETRDFHPHLTLGRADPKGGAGHFRGLDEVMAGLEFQSEVSIHTLDLMESHLSREGARYGVLSSARLGVP
jgi:RNA 2',3'-cyclic 3'-phosphodiesterase